MSSSNPRIDRLKVMLGLEEKRVALQQQLDAIQKQLAALKDRLFDDTPVTAAKPAVKTGRKGRAQRGALKEQIVSALQAAGNTGVRVTELAAALGTKAANVHAWFHSTAKSVPGIVKISGGHYRLDSGKAAAAKAAKPTKAKGRKKGKGAKRGELTSKIQAALAAAGKNGLSIKDLADKVGAKYRNVSVWLVTTGKNFPKIKKTGPAHYRLVD